MVSVFWKKPIQLSKKLFCRLAGKAGHEKTPLDPVLRGSCCLCPESDWLEATSAADACTPRNPLRPIHKTQPAALNQGRHCYMFRSLRHCYLPFLFGPAPRPLMKTFYPGVSRLSTPKIKKNEYHTKKVRHPKGPHPHAALSGCF